MENEILDQHYWNNRWEAGSTGWDLGETSGPLAALIDKLEDKNLDILIPGCGNAWEAEYLFNSDFQNLTVLDISPIACRNLEKRFHDKPRIKIICQDFFQHKGQYDLILEQTFFCALAPELRPTYVEHMAELLKPGGILAGLLFDVEFDLPGPPFGGKGEDYKKLMEEKFTILQFEKSQLSHPKRLGNEVFFKVIKP
jgi:SAM-dependent methyltransferase